MASIARSEETDYSKYSAYTEEGDNNSTAGASTSFAIQSNTAAGSLSLADANFDNRVKQRKQSREYSRDEFLYAISSPSSIGAIAWVVSSFVAVIYGSSIVIFLNFCIPMFVGPYVINKQMTAQLLPSVRRKFNKLHDKANILAMENVGLKGIVSRLQRQEYRLSVVEERFEQICKRGDKDITKMKHLAKRNAGLRQTIKANLAAKKIQEFMTNMLTSDDNGNCRIHEKDIDNVVMLMKVFAGRKAGSKFDKDAIHEAVVNSMANNAKARLIPNINIGVESEDSETRESERDYDERMMNNNADEKAERMYNNEEGNMEEEAQPNKDISVKSSQQSYKMEPSSTTDVDDDEEEEESWTTLNNNNDPSLKLDPSGRLLEKRYRNEDYGGMVQPTMSNGTAESPIDIENLLFNSISPKMEQEDQTRHYSAHQERRSMILPIE